MNRLGWVVLALVLLFVGKAWGDASVSDVVPQVVVDTVVPADYQRIVSDLAIASTEVGTLRGRLRGLSERAPERVVITDTVTVTDTVFVNVDSRGRLTYQSFRGDIVLPQLRIDIDVSDCDDGWQIRDDRVLCNEARLGHLWVGPVASIHPAAAIWWKPSYRSPWEVSVSYSGSWDFAVRRGVQLW